MNPFVLLLATCAFLGATPTFAMDTDPAETQTTIVKAAPSLEEQINRVAAFAQQRKASHLPVKMVLGATNLEGDRITDESFIFFDMTSHNPEGRPYIQANFNDIDQLSRLAKPLGHSLNQIVVDDSTFKFAEWKTPHLQLFASMLAPDGEFVFCPYVQFTGLNANFHGSTDKEILTALIQINPFSLDKLPTGYDIPSLIPSPEDLNTSEVQEAVAKYAPLKPFTSLDWKAFNAKYFELDLQKHIDAYPSTVVNDENKLKKNIAAKLKVPQARKLAMENVYLPHIQAVLEQHFKDIRLEKNVPFAVPSRCNERANMLFYAKNPKHTD